MKIRPLYDRVVIRRSEENRTSSGGIVIPDTAKDKPVLGEIIAIGDGKILDNNQKRPLAVKVGDKVLFAKYAGTEVKLGDEDVLVMREEDLMGVVEG